jgi:sugar lactone lactonase YvrE
MEPTKRQFLKAGARAAALDAMPRAAAQAAAPWQPSQRYPDPAIKMVDPSFGRYRLGRIDLPERCANVCFGGVYRNRLFMAASTSVYSVYVNTQGVAGG